MSALHDPDPARARPALEYLCASYWYPLYVFVRRQGYPPDQAQDVVQGLFERLLERDTLKKADREKGRFSSFLLTCLRRHMLTLQKRVASSKRGGGQQILSLDVARAEERYGLESAQAETPDEAFERHWALAVVERVFEGLRAESAACGRGQLFAQLRGAIAGEKGERTYAEMAKDLGLTEKEVKKAVADLRARYRELFCEEVARLVEKPEEVKPEIQHLFKVLTR